MPRPTELKGLRPGQLPPMGGWQPSPFLTPLRVVVAFGLVALGVIIGRLA
jgi:hypothetical protein